MIRCMFYSSYAARGRMGSHGHEEGIKGVDLGCGSRSVGVQVGMKY